MNSQRQYRPATIEVDLSALKHNALLVKQQCQHSQVMAAIKANAYGHGILQAAESLKEVVDEYAVASMDDVAQIRQSLTHCSDIGITVLSGFYHKDEILDAAHFNASLVIYDLQQVSYMLEYEYIDSEVFSSKKLNIWLKVDTGMNRLGLQMDQLPSVIEKIESNKYIKLRGIISHFANADDIGNQLNKKQILQFEKLRARFQKKPWLWSLANSAGIFNFSNIHHDWVRPGIMLYGGSPLQGISAAELDLQAVMTFSSQVVSMRMVKSGQSIGYGSLWVAEKDTFVAVVACGYGDGYPRCIKADTPVLLAGQKTTILGRVSMDLLVVDATGINASVGSEVVLWGKGLPVEEIAQSVGTISYELFCGITERVTRAYINE